MEPAVDAREVWLLAGQQLLREGGLPAVKLAALTTRVGRTTGSFYHHFPSMGAYLEALAHHYGTDQVTAALAALRPLEPPARLAGLAELARDRRMAPLDAAMRDWAGTSPAAAAAVERADHAILRFLAEAFADAGFAASEARTRAVALFAVGVARIHLPWPVAPTAVDDLLALLTDR